MKKGFVGTSMLGALVLVVISTSTFVAQRTRNRPVEQSAPVKDLKIKYRMSVAGRGIETTTMIKGARERSETNTGYGMDIVNLTQCDLKRTIQISDKTKKYLITPMDTGDSTPTTGTSVADTSGPSRRGGLITYVLTSTDTGERKEMFGFQARHVKTSTSIESSPDACNPLKQRMETDGWYIDFNFGLNCEVGRPQLMGAPPARGGCQDRVSYKRVGTGRTGYPLSETMTSYGPNGEVVSTITKEVVELSREPLDAALFDVPAGYVETKNSQELYGMPSMEAIMSQAKGRTTAEDNQRVDIQTIDNTKAPGTIRVGVVQINNKTDHDVSTESLRQRLVGEIQGGNLDAISLNASSPGEAETEAKAKQCDYILYTDISTLKVSAAKKLGGMFGRATGVGSGGIDKTEAKVEFKLFAVSETSPRLQSSASAKEEGDEASAGTALDQEARMVIAEVRKKGRG
ncbi:MAG TPA: hypothetical protein VIF64_21155 [Pyrinomonadaceae bacterium]|jgi:hypothetical protein